MALARSKTTSVKSPVAKKAPSKKAAAKKATTSQSIPRSLPVKVALTKSSLIDLIAEKNELSRKAAKSVLSTIEDAMTGSIHPRGVGEFTFPGLFKIALQKVPARKAGTLVRNPSTGEMVSGAAKPANVRVKIRALSKLKGATTA